jgi:hypothetical protein
MQLEGKFSLPELLRLDPEEQGFVLEFVRSSGSLKEMGEHLKLSYPTVRNRLNDIIAKLNTPVPNVEAERRRILDAIAKGELSVKEAAKRLKEIQ